MKQRPGRIVVGLVMRWKRRGYVVGSYVGKGTAFVGVGEARTFRSVPHAERYVLRNAARFPLGAQIRRVSRCECFRISDVKNIGT